MVAGSSPKVSVLMTVKDGEKYVRTAIESILAQTFTDFECIIINDGSRDATADIIREYSDSRIIFLSNPNNLGLSKSLNIGLEKARGIYLARMDADDISVLHRFELQVNYLDAHPEIAVLGGGFSLIDADNKILQSFQFPLSHEVIVWSLAFFNPIVHPSVMMRTSVVKALDSYNVQLRRSQDYDLWWRVSFSSKLGNLAETLVLLRQHATQVSREYRSDQLEHGIEINAKHLSRALREKVSSTLISNMWSGNVVLARDALEIGNLIWKWYRSNISKTRSKLDKLYITNDALTRINALRAPFTGNYRLLPLAIKSYLLGASRKYGV